MKKKKVVADVATFGRPAHFVFVFAFVFVFVFVFVLVKVVLEADVADVATFGH